MKHVPSLPGFSGALILLIILLDPLQLLLDDTGRVISTYHIYSIRHFRHLLLISILQPMPNNIAISIFPLRQPLMHFCLW